ncbi:uncharacterized protein METZ01_LOCUS103362 [marine metagenome]|uniref:Uncharacterized protein n=1 Tax=marine metagenome TaxID=408172 RepID=A0A381WEM7_9ZZZZ
MKASVGVFVSVVALLLAVNPVAAQDIPRLADGHPDMSGIWQVLNEANYDLEPHMARHSLQMREGPVNPVPAIPTLRMGAVGAVPGSLGVIVGGGKIPYTAEARALKEENMAEWIDRSPEVKCYMPGVPRATYMPMPFQIIQSETDVFIAYQFAGAVRDIYMDNPGPSQVDSWMGWSVGNWEGDTLVVDVTGLLDGTWFDRAGSHHSTQLHVVERYTMISPDHIDYEATIEDPVVLTEPFTIKMPIYRRIEENARLMDFRCVEFVEELLFGEWRRTPLPR